MQNIVILDRDGVINYDSEQYIKTPDEWVAIPGSLEAIAKLNKANYLVVVATNQSGIARGLFDELSLQKIHDKMRIALAAKDGHIDDIFYCPHGPEDNCNCRKPKTGLFEAIAKKYQCSLGGIPAIGDSERDIQAALTVGCRAMLVKSSGKNEQFAQKNLVEIYRDLAQAVDSILEPINIG